MNEKGDAGGDLARLYRDREPAPELEERIVADYARSIDMRTRRGARVARYGQIAAAIVLFAAGYGAAVLGQRAESRAADERTTIASTGAGGGDRFMLLLWEDARFDTTRTPAPADREYGDWARATAARGIPVDGSELATERFIVGDAARPHAADGAARIGGYFMVTTDDARAARQLAEAHPHTRRHGWIEVVQLVDTGPE